MKIILIFALILTGLFGHMQSAYASTLEECYQNYIKEVESNYQALSKLDNVNIESLEQFALDRVDETDTLFKRADKLAIKSHQDMMKSNLALKKSNHSNMRFQYSLRIAQSKSGLESCLMKSKSVNVKEKCATDKVKTNEPKSSSKLRESSSGAGAP